MQVSWKSLTYKTSRQITVYFFFLNAHENYYPVLTLFIFEQKLIQAFRVNIIRDTAEIFNYYNSGNSPKWTKTILTQKVRQQRK